MSNMCLLLRCGTIVVTAINFVGFWWSDSVSRVGYLSMFALCLPGNRGEYSRLQKSCNKASRTVENHNWFTTYEYDYLSRPTSLFKHNKSIVVFHCSACLLQDFCNLLYPTYDTATCLTARNPQNLWQFPQLYHILKAGTVRSSIICWAFASFPGRHEANMDKYPNTWYCYESDCQKPTKFMAVTTVVPHLKSRHLLDIPISLLHPK